MRTLLYSLLIICTFSLCSACSDKTAEQAPSAEKKQSNIAEKTQAVAPREIGFNLGWKFTLADGEEFSKVDFDDSRWRNQLLPHDWSIDLDFDEKLNGATAYLPGGIGWYRKTFTLPEGAKGKVVYINFDGIYNHSQIWLNGEKIGGRINGYTPFFYDISQFIKQDGENVIAVRVDRTRYIDSRWYTGSGIYRDVTLVAVDPLHIPIWGTYLTTPEVTEALGTVNLDVEILNNYPANKTFSLKTSILDSEGSTVASISSETTVVQAGAADVNQKLNVEKPKLWSPENPNLYTAVTDIVLDGKTVDSYKTRFGFRHIRYDAEKGFFLNGKNIAIKGVNLHHGAGLVGAAVPDDVWRRRFELLKEAGTNAIRTAHNPMSKNFMDLCDEMGFLVQAEIFDEWDNPKDKRLNQWERHDDYISRGYADYFQEEAESDLKLAVKRDRNHPSVIMWSIGNEIEWTYPRYKEATGYFDMNASGNYFFSPPWISPEEIYKRFHESEEGKYVLAKTAKKLSGWVKELDKTRPVTANMILPAVSHISGYADALDIIGYSYRRVIYDYGHKLFPEKMIMGTENLPQWHEWKAIEERDFIPGTFLWTGIDYLGESNDAWPRKAIESGLLDTAGFKKPSFHMFKSLWDKTSHIYITSQTEEKSLYKTGDKNTVVEKEPGQWEKRLWTWQDVNEHWNYKAKERVIVEVLSNCEAVELFLNGNSLGVQKLSENEDHILKWAVDFEKGKLEAKGCETSHKVATAGKPAVIKLSTDRTNLDNDNSSVAHIVAQVYDADGNPVRSQSVDLEFVVPDTLEVLGVDNGKTSLMQRYQSTKLQTHQGRALLIVRALKDGPHSVKAVSEGLSEASMTVN